MWKHKLQAIWAILTCKSFWIVFKKNDDQIYRLRSKFHIRDIPMAAQDMIDVVNAGLMGQSAVDEANEIINNLK